MDISTPTHRLSEYLARAAGTPLPEPVIAKTRLHVLDTIAAILSGSAMPAGRAGLAYARRYACDGPAPIFGTPAMAAPADAALANGMSAHADETDDSHAPSLSHPGCAVVPAVLAVASGRNVPGQVLLRAVAAGYDAGTRVGMAIGHPDSPLEGSSISTHAHVGVYAAAAAAAVFMSLDAEQMRAVLSFAAQSAAGTTSWARDPYHVEKAFVFGGMPASNGVRAAQLVESGCLGVADVFAGAPNVLDAYSPAPDPSRLGAGLGEVYEIERTNIKKFAVGSPSQAALQAVLDILADRPVDPGEIERIVIEIPYDLAKVVDGRESPNINVQYLVCGTIIDGRFSFAMAHDSTRFTDHTVRDLMGRAELRYDRSVTGVRQASVDIILRSGETLYAFVATVRGSADNPMSAGEVVEKASDLIKPVVGTPRTDRIVDIVLSLGDGADAASLLDALHP